VKQVLLKRKKLLEQQLNNQWIWKYKANQREESLKEAIKDFKVLFKIFLYPVFVNYSMKKDLFSIIFQLCEKKFLIYIN
jgi:hypothetical protein